MDIFVGSGAAVCTPFFGTGTVNYDAYEKLIRFQAENGTDAIVACATTGESPTLDDAEHVETVSAAVSFTRNASANGKKIPVIAGAGGNNTAHCIELGKELIKVGVDALMYCAPYYNKTTQKGLIAHYTAIASALPVPIVVYNIPIRTVYNITPKSMYELSKIENIVAVKEASGDIAQIAEVIEYCGGDLAVYAGNDDYIVPVLSLGGKGVISTAANIAPAQVHDMVMKYINGDTAGAADMQLKMLALIRALFSEVNPIPVKAALNLMGFNVGECRMPLTAMDEKLLENLKKQMTDYGLL